MFDVSKDTYCLCSNFAVDFFEFLSSTEAACGIQARGGYPVHLSRPPFTAVRPENGRKSTRNHLYTCVNTNAVFSATFPCILFRFLPHFKSTAVCCGVLRYSGIPYLAVLTVCNTYWDAGKGNLTAQNTRKPFCGRGSAPDPAEGAYSAPTNPLVGGEGLAVPSPRTHPRSRPFGPRLFYPHSKISSNAVA